MDTVPRLTTRQRLRRLRYGLPNAIRAALLALALMFVAGVLAGISFSAQAIGTVEGTAIPSNQYKLCYTWGSQGSNPSKLGSPPECMTGAKAAVCAAFVGWVAADNAYADNNQYGYSYEAVPTVNSSDPNCTGGVLVSKTQKPANQCTNFCTTTSTIGVNAGYTTVVVYNTTCPSNSVASGATCTCDLGYRPPFSGPQNACNPYSCESKPRANDRVLEGLTTKPVVCDGSPGCVQNYCDTYRSAYQTNDASDYGCNIKESLYAAQQGADGKWSARYVSAYSGAPCVDSGVANPSSPVQPAGTPASAPGVDGSASQPSGTCAAGTCPGTFNGQAMCQPCSRTVGETTTTSVDTNASGVATGTTVTNKKADCIGDVCTTTTTTTTNGSVTNTTTTTESKDSMCKASPNHPACGGGGGGGGDGEGEEGGTWFNGTCAAGAFACSPNTDAATCAIATEMHRRNCTLFDNVTPEVTEGLSYMTGASSPEGHPANTPTVIDIGARFNASMLTNPLGASCPGDQQIAGITIPLASACTALQLLGTLAVACTVLMCAGWLVTKGV